MLSNPIRTVEPVVVTPETDSKNALVSVSGCWISRNGKQPNADTPNQAAEVVRNTWRGAIL